ncbi:RHS repeat-associated core domain-containing protein [Chitinophaga pinensis]|uniref:Pierisin-like domain-containing protein n=1 Tax=Chitinophaga pinensis (strain ATCC 43595 / DSM 2588 / LMG 13176 / NBRC 15968 / NCIMB 11800 / UQM 2034) TaxID=485918 RepID=A0A979G7N7_CHIPD|nr:RHS repeat-associated core domain-containing protein [Chitinophaga pinensis]ACU62217.1 hypothetical protein Cpin_4783 [Chitinophaga pinensis DSM 2588]
MSSGGYRYGFNGKENDDEVKGEGNQQDYGMRVYDPRIGKFLSVDPLSVEYPWNSTYAFAENDVIRSIDLDGAEKRVKTYSYTMSGGKTVLTVTDNVWKQQTDISIHLLGAPQTDKQIAAHSAITYQKVPKPDNGSFAFFEFSPELKKANYGKYTYTDNNGKQQVQYFSSEELQFRIDEIEAAKQRLNKDINIAAASANLVGAGMLAKAELSSVPKEPYLYRGSMSEPSNKFVNGFKAKGTNYDLWEHLQSNPKNSAYISTTKLKDLAADYGYFVYEIRFQKNGIDINAKYGTSNKWHYENEVSVPDQIKNTDIRGAYKVNSDGTLGDFIPNPNFKR